jgi:hypothetical protein
MSGCLARLTGKDVPVDYRLPLSAKLRVVSKLSTPIFSFEYMNEAVVVTESPVAYRLEAQSPAKSMGTHVARPRIDNDCRDKRVGNT